MSEESKLLEQLNTLIDRERRLNSIMREALIFAEPHIDDPVAEALVRLALKHAGVEQ